MENIMMTFTDEEMRVLELEIGKAIEQEEKNVETGKTDDKEYLNKLRALFDKIYDAC